MGWDANHGPSGLGAQCVRPRPADTNAGPKKPAPRKLSFGFFFFGCYGSIMAERFQAINGQLRRRFQAIKGRFSEHKWPAINGVKRPFMDAIKGRASFPSRSSSLDSSLLFFSLHGFSGLSCCRSISSLVIVRSLSSSSLEAVLIGVQVLLVRRCILGNRRSTYSQNTRGEGESVLRKACSSRASAIFPLYFFIF